MRALRPILAALALAAPAGAQARDCAPRGTPPGVRLPDRPGCPPAKPANPREELSKPRSGRTPGFVDVGGGTEVRINGRVGAETRFGR